jgi:group I intron endonuclease
METADTNNYFIYCLKDPISLEIRYIGFTSKTLKYRLSKHIDNAKYNKHNKHLCNWILKYLKLDLKPIIELIEICNEDNWIEREKYWIKCYSNLLNISEGGDKNIINHTEETKQLLRIQKLGKKPSKETLEKRSKSLKGRIFSEEHKKKISESNKKRSLEKNKIKVIDIVNNIETIYLGRQAVKEACNIGLMTIYRNLNKDKIIKNQYKLVKI